MKKILAFLKRKKKLFIILAILIAVVAFFAIRSAGQQQKTLQFATVTRKELIQTLEVTGVIDAKTKADLYFATGGKLVYLGASEGATVKRGQTLATIDQATLEKQLEQNLNNYESQRLTHEDALDTYRDRVITDKEALNKSLEQNTLENSVIAVELNSIAIRNTLLSAPFAGVLTHRPNVVPGVQLAATDYFEVVDPNSLLLRANVDETDLHLLQVGQNAKVTFDAYDNDEIDSQLSYISYVSQETATGTVFEVQFPLASASLDRYRIGMNATANIELAKKDATLAVPIEAVRQSDGKYLLDVKANNKAGFETREVQVGLETEDEMEILSGVSEGEEVVIPQ